MDVIHLRNFRMAMLVSLAALTLSLISLVFSIAALREAVGL